MTAMITNGVEMPLLENRTIVEKKSETESQVWEEIAFIGKLVLSSIAILLLMVAAFALSNLTQCQPF